MAKPKTTIKQQSIKGTNIPELEAAAEAYRLKVAELQALQVELKTALNALVDQFQKEKKVKSIKLGEDGVIYLYQSADDKGNEKLREIKEVFTRNRKVNTAKTDA